MWFIFCSLLLLYVQYDFAVQLTNKMDSESLDQIPDVEIDDNGDFKYILLKVKDLEGRKKFLVRGTRRCFYHAEILNEYTGGTLKLKKATRVLGGGRITHTPEEKAIKIYGDSMGFGKADHNITADVLKKFYPDYNITVTDETKDDLH